MKWTCCRAWLLQDASLLHMAQDWVSDNESTNATWYPKQGWIKTGTCPQLILVTCMNWQKLNIVYSKDFQNQTPLAAPSFPSMNVCDACWVNNAPWVLLALESQESVKEREWALVSVGLVQLPLTLISVSKRGTTFCLLFPLAPIFHSAVSMITNIFFHYLLTYTLKWYLFHLLVFSCMPLSRDLIQGLLLSNYTS